MCTVTWRFTADGFELFCNRDELFTRLPAEPPSPAERAGVRYLAPRDGDFGGTWVLVNEHGVGLCLVNRAHRRPEALSAEPPSRGLLLVGLADLARPEELSARLAALDLAAHRGFALVALAPPADPAHPAASASWAAWDGVELAARSAAAVPMPLYSSVPDPEGVARRRGAILERLAARHGAGTRACLEAFHASHGDAPGPHSPCMHGTEGATQSHTRLEVTQRDVAVRYAPGPPCTTPLGPALRLPRAEPARRGRDGS